MSVAVELSELPTAVAAQIGWCYLLTVSDDGQPRALAVAPTIAEDGRFTFEVGRGTAANVASRPAVTLLYPPADPAAMSLIVDGTATIEVGTVAMTPTWAVLHRSALPSTAP
jgi:hypothetical protein